MAIRQEHGNPAEHGNPEGAWNGESCLITNIKEKKL